jgi:hypothetical protein
VLACLLCGPFKAPKVHGGWNTKNYYNRSIFVLIFCAMMLWDFKIFLDEFMISCSKSKRESGISSL